MATKRTKKSLANVVVTEEQRLKLIADALKHTEKVNRLRPVYPSPNAKLTLGEIKALGFTGAHDTVIYSPEEADSGLEWRGGRRRNKNRGKKSGGGNRGGGNRGGGGKTLADPKVIATEVERPLADIPNAGMDGDIYLGEQNWENCEETKANYFNDAIKAIVLRHHVMFCVEVSPKGVQVMANNTGYAGYVSQANNRQQAVGFLVHPRLEVLKIDEYSNVAEVMGIPDLRSAYRLWLKDKTSGKHFSTVVVHLKSMRGGEAQTDPVAYKQCQELVKSLGKGTLASLMAVGNLQVFAWFTNPKLGRNLTDHGLCRITLKVDGIPDDEELIIIAGDWNRKINSTRALDPLYDAGWLCRNRKDATATQITGPSRLDGYICNNHNDKACGAGNGGDPHGPFSDDPSASPAVDINK